MRSLKENNRMGVLVCCVVAIAFIIYLLLMVSFLDKRVSKLEDTVNASNLEGVITAVNKDGIPSINENDLTDTNLAYLGTQKTDQKFFINGLKVVSVDYDLGVICTDNIRIFLSDYEQSMYVRAGDTVYLFGSFYSGNSTGTYVRKAVLYSVEFDGHILHIRNEE